MPECDVTPSIDSYDIQDIGRIARSVDLYGNDYIIVKCTIKVKWSAVCELGSCDGHCLERGPMSGEDTITTWMRANGMNNDHAKGIIGFLNLCYKRRSTACCAEKCSDKLKAQDPFYDWESTLLEEDIMFFLEEQLDDGCIGPTDSTNCLCVEHRGFGSLYQTPIGNLRASANRDFRAKQAAADKANKRWVAMGNKGTKITIHDTRLNSEVDCSKQHLSCEQECVCARQDERNDLERGYDSAARSHARTTEIMVPLYDNIKANCGWGQEGYTGTIQTPEGPRSCSEAYEAVMAMDKRLKVLTERMEGYIEEMKALDKLTNACIENCRKKKVEGTGV